MMRHDIMVDLIRLPVGEAVAPYFGKVSLTLTAENDVIRLQSRSRTGLVMLPQIGAVALYNALTAE